MLKIKKFYFVENLKKKCQKSFAKSSQNKFLKSFKSFTDFKVELCKSLKSFQFFQIFVVIKVEKLKISSKHFFLKSSNHLKSYFSKKLYIRGNKAKTVLMNIDNWGYQQQKT